MRIRANLGVAAGMLGVLVALILASPGGAFGLDGNTARLAKVALIILVAFAWMNVPFLLAYAIVGHLLGAHVRRISIGTGPSAVTLQVGHSQIALAPFLFGGFVQYDEHAGKGLRQLPAISQMLIALSGPIGAIAASALVLRDETVSAAAHTWRQVYQVATDFSGPWDVIPSILTAEHDSGLPFVIALIATKAAAVNLLPIPVLAGGSAVMNLVEAVRGRLLTESEQHKVASAGLAVCLALAVLICGRFAYEAYQYANSR